MNPMLIEVGINILLWLALCAVSYQATRVIILLLDPNAEPDYVLRANWTDGHYVTHWATIYQTNPALHTRTFEAFLRDPQRYLQEALFASVNEDPHAQLPLLPEQRLASLAIYCDWAVQDLADQSRQARTSTPQTPSLPLQRLLPAPIQPVTGGSHHGRT